MNLATPICSSARGRACMCPGCARATVCSARGARGAEGGDAHGSGARNQSATRPFAAISEYMYHSFNV